MMHHPAVQVAQAPAGSIIRAGAKTNERSLDIPDVAPTEALYGKHADLEQLQTRLDSLSAAAIEIVFEFCATEMGSAYKEHDAQLDVRSLDRQKLFDLGKLIDIIEVRGM